MNNEELAKHILFVEGAGQALITHGLMEGPVSITPRGVGAYDQLVASGWQPNRHIVRRLLRDKGVPETQLEMTTDLFMRVAEEPEKS